LLELVFHATPFSRSAASMMPWICFFLLIVLPGAAGGYRRGRGRTLVGRG